MKTPWVFITAFALVFYTTGAAFIESFVNYPSWPLIGESEFIAYHRFISPRVLMLLVVPAVLGTVCNILMLWFRPQSIPRWSVWLSIALQAIVWISSAAIQIPIQVQLSAKGLSMPLIERLIQTNLLLRRIPYAITAVLFVWMMVKTLQGEDPPKDVAA